MKMLIHNVYQEQNICVLNLAPIKVLYTGFLLSLLLMCLQAQIRQEHSCKPFHVHRSRDIQDKFTFESPHFNGVLLTFNGNRMIPYRTELHTLKVVQLWF